VKRHHGRTRGGGKKERGPGRPGTLNTTLTPCFACQTASRSSRVFFEKFCFSRQQPVSHPDRSLARSRLVCVGIASFVFFCCVAPPASAKAVIGAQRSTDIATRCSSWANSSNPSRLALSLAVPALLAQTESTCHFSHPGCPLVSTIDNDPGPIAHLNSTNFWHLEARPDPRVARAPSDFVPRHCHCSGPI